MVSRSRSQQPTFHPVRLDLVLLARSVRRSVSHAIAVQPRRCGKAFRDKATSIFSTDCFVGDAATREVKRDEPQIDAASVPCSQCRLSDIWAQVRLTCGGRALTRRISSRGCSHMPAQLQSGCGRLVRCSFANHLSICSYRDSFVVWEHERLTCWLHFLPSRPQRGRLGAQVRLSRGWQLSGACSCGVESTQRPLARALLADAICADKMASMHLTLAAQPNFFLACSWSDSFKLLRKFTASLRARAFCIQAHKQT